MSKKIVHRWCRQFSEGCQSAHDEERSGRPSLINADLVNLVPFKGGKVLPQSDTKVDPTIRHMSQFWPEVILSMDELNLDQAPQYINKEEFQLEREHLQAFVAATEPGCEKELIRSSSLGLLNYNIESKLKDVLPNIVIMLKML
ncbi:uncharacterized protein TNCV_211041 [Trichonephila clavipes]|uniref:Uncharacterized protein n=1 Tax=Trichonephila clavipes TaxID=2585209 RepID=A0A8X6T3C2_TRICX|nr:uncharacterized protein TNCV_211041 [Trichonephila clavipes]